jgi:hypothetical protein
MRGSGEAKRARAAFIDKALASPKARSQGEAVFAAADRQARHLNGQEARAVELGLLDPAAARRSKLITWRSSSRREARDGGGARQARGGGVQFERAARAHVDSLPKGSPARAAALQDLKDLRDHRVAVSGRDPRGVLAHERAKLAHGEADRRARAAEADVARLERAKQRLSGRQQVQRGGRPGGAWSWPAACRRAAARGAGAR